VVREQVSVAIEDDGDAGVAGARSDLLGMSAGGDPERDCGVTEVVNTQRREPRRFDGRIPEAPTKQAGPDRLTFGRGETRPIGSPADPPSALSSSTTKPGNVTVRIAALVFGGPKLIWPRTAASVSLT